MSGSTRLPQGVVEAGARADCDIYFGDGEWKMTAKFSPPTESERLRLACRRISKLALTRKLQPTHSKMRVRIGLRSLKEKMK